METVTSKIEFLENNFGEVSLSRDGTNAAVKCPACGKDNKKKKFSICLDTWRCHCWVCGVKGKNLFQILKKYRGEDSAYLYAQKFQISTGDKNLNVVEAPVVKLPKDFMLFASNLSCEDPDFQAALNYLKHRGVKKEDLWRHKIGTCITGGYWNRRLIFPSFDKEMKLNYYVSRTIDDETFPKYVNAKADKREVVFDEIRIDWSKEITLVEGVFDLIKCNDNATCLLGSSLSENHETFKKIVKNNTPVMLALDHDVIQKTYKIAKLLFNYGIEVKIMNTKDIVDVGTLTKQEFSKRAKEADNYTGDTNINFLISSIRSGSVF